MVVTLRGTQEPAKAKETGVRKEYHDGSSQQEAHISPQR